ncbi:hypothetical protein F383_34446 [Gossypium arboreum]|nr:hypothetical protein F383_34446 [Gossypium arboreum]
MWSYSHTYIGITYRC